MIDPKWTNRAIIHKAIEHHCRYEQNWVIERPYTWFLTLKCILLVLLDRQYKGTERYLDPVTVAVIDGGSFPCEWGTCYWYEYVGVGIGYFKNWWIIYDHDGSP